MIMEFTKIHRDLGFLSESIRLQYTNFIFKHQSQIDDNLTYESILRRIKNDEPIEYIFNIAEFYNREFYVDNRCLIPRFETKKIIEQIVEYVQDKNEEFSIIDVGTGSGIIAITIAKEIPRVKILGITAIDVSKDALEVAQINCNRHHVNEIVSLQNIDFREMDFSIFPNLIVTANLPYIPLSEKLQASVKNFEPHLALFGGEKGDELNEILISRIKKLPNVRAYFYEGYNGEISSEIIR